MKECRECQHRVSEKAQACPGCGVPYPAKEHWDGWGFEYKSKWRVLGLPLLHISFKYSYKSRPVPAVGIISIGQFGAGVINISQIGIGVFSLSQVSLSLFAIAQFALGYAGIAQMGLFIEG